MNNIWLSRAARLIQGDPVTVTGTNAAFASCPLPRLPLSLCCHAREFFGRCYERYGRCIAALLIFNGRDQRWLPPHVPRQRCGTRYASALDPGFLEDLPPYYCVLGCLQSATAKTPTAALTRLMPVDGIFAVMPPDRSDNADHWFYRINGEVLPIPSSCALVDDWTQTLTHFQSHLRL